MHAHAHAHMHIIINNNCKRVYDRRLVITAWYLGRVAGTGLAWLVPTAEETQAADAAQPASPLPPAPPPPSSPQPLSFSPERLSPPRPSPPPAYVPFIFCSSASPQ
jgi:hypothetical protein